MYKTLSLLTFVLLFNLVPNHSFAQFEITIAGKRYHIAHFKEDSVGLFNNQFVKDGVLPSIKQSKYDLEIRYYFNGAFGWFPGEGHCIVIHGNKNKLFAVDYSLKKFVYKDKSEDSGRVIHKYDIPGVFRIGLHIKELTPKVSLDSLLKVLFTNRIADLPTDSVIISRLKSNRIHLKELDCMDCGSGAYYEVKIGKHFRNFVTSNQYSMNNQNIPELRNESEIDKVFYTLAPNFFQ